MRKIHRFWKIAKPFYLRVMRHFTPTVHDGGPPTGCFSEALAIENRLVTGERLQSKFSLKLAADSEVYKAGIGQGDHTDWPVVWSRRSDASLLGPSMVHVDPKGRACTEAMYGPHAWTDPAWRRIRKRKAVILSGPHTSIISRWNTGDNYYHWFMDGLTRLWHLDHFPADIRIITPSDLPEFAIRSIELLGLSDRIVPINDCDLRIEDYWFAGPTMLSGCPDPLGVSWLRNKFISHQAIPGTDLIYVDRGQHRRKCKNGDNVANWFKSRGWLVVNPGEMTLDQQISTFGRAKIVAGIHGAGLTNILWIPAGGHVFEIMPSKRRNGCYAGLAACVGASHKSLVVKSDRRANINVSLSSLEDWISF
jgi:hypothetical protein